MLHSGIIDDVVEIALSAGNIILRFYDDQFSIMQKSDGSPVTAADQAAEDYIIPALTRLTPHSNHSGGTCGNGTNTRC